MDSTRWNRSSKPLFDNLTRRSLLKGAVGGFGGSVLGSAPGRHAMAQNATQSSTPTASPVAGRLTEE